MAAAPEQATAGAGWDHLAVDFQLDVNCVMMNARGPLLRIGCLSFAVVQLLVTISRLSAVEPAVFRDDFREPLLAWMNGEISSEAMSNEMNRLDGVLARAGERWDYLYWRSRTAYIRGQIHYERGEKDESLAELDACREFARASLDDRETSEGWRMMAEASTLIMVQRGLGYIILHFSQGQNEAKRALELDPRNARASHIIAQFLCNAPRIAGGNLGEGLAILRSESQRTDVNDEDRFVLLLSLSAVLGNEGQTAEAIRVCREALTLFPGNERGLEQLEGLESGTR